MHSNCRYLGFEVNPSLCEMLRRRFPQAHFCHESVANAGYVCTTERMDDADCVISGLPWAAFPESRQRQFLDAMMTVLRPGGQFTTFAYLHGLSLPAGRRFRELLRSRFSYFAWSEVVWLNVPPAVVYRCRR
jgi:phospholipid N-methyltransferase